MSANRRSSFQPASPSFETIRRTSGNLLGPLGCSLLLGKGSYQAPFTSSKH